MTAKRSATVTRAYVDASAHAQRQLAQGLFDRARARIEELAAKVENAPTVYPKPADPSPAPQQGWTKLVLERRNGRLHLSLT